MQTLNVLITRPSHQAQALETALLAAGYQTFLLPTIDITPLADSTELQQLLTQLNQFHFLIFTSANAVQHSTALIKQTWPQFPEQVQVIAIGPGTRKALETNGLPVNLMPQQANSESLLALPDVQQIQQKNIAIITGLDGRQLLANALQARGAIIKTVCVYRRQLPQVDKTAISRQCRDWQIDVVISTSSDSLRNFYQMLDVDGKAWLQQVTLLLISDRMLATVKEMHLQGRIILADNASEPAIVAALEAFRTQQQM